MAATVQDVLKVNIVLVGVPLLRFSEEVDKFRNDVGTEMIVSGAGLRVSVPEGNAEPGVSIALNKDRISIDLSPSRTSLARDYPAQKDLVRMAEVSRLAIEASDTSDAKPRAFGYNIELVFDQTTDKPAIEYLSERLFRGDLATSLGWEPIGGSGRLFFRDGVSRWSLNLEPRFQDEQSGRVFLGANRHFEEPRLPEMHEILPALQDLWDQAHQFIQQLDGSVQ